MPHQHLAPVLAGAHAGGEDHAAWTTPLPPFRIAENLYYVGSRDLASYLVTTPAGNILINANLVTNVPQIRHSIQQLGFRWRDTRILLISHAHFDHAAGAFAVRRETGAQLMVMDGDVSVMETGGRTDFAFPGPQFPPVHVDRVLHDGDTVNLGGITLTAHKTAGHTRGCTTWTMSTREPGDPRGPLLHVVIVGSWNVLSNYRLVSSPGRPASYPGIAADYEHEFATLRALPCDIFLGAHGSFFNLLGKLPQMQTEGDRVWIDPQGCREAVAAAEASFQRTLTEQKQNTATSIPR